MSMRAVGNDLLVKDRVGTMVQDVVDATTPPDGGYGWVCLACCFTINAFTWGVASSFGVYLSFYLTNSFFPGATPLDYALVGGLSFGMAMLSAPIVTALVRCFGIKPPMFAGSIMLGGSFVAASFATRTWHLYLTQGVLFGLGLGFTWLPSPGILSQWFGRRRSFAQGIASAGSGIGGLIFSLATGAMIDNLSLGWALRITGIIAFVCTAVAATFLRDRNSTIQPQQRAFDTVLLRRLDVLLLLSWGFLSMLGYMCLLYSLSDFARSIHLTTNQAIQITAYLNLGTALGRPFVGVASDRLGRFELAISMTLLCGVLCLAVWIPATSFGVATLFAILSGAVLGVFWMTIAPLSAEVVGLKQLPSILSLAYLSVVLPTTFSETVALYLRRPSNARPYLYTQIYCGICYICASACLYGVRMLCRGREP